MSSDDERVSPRDFEYKYRRFRTEAGNAFRQEVDGTGIPNGYTTREQALELADLLHVGDGDLLLDLGAGRGWPGGAIAEVTGARLVSVDLPLEALRQGRAWLRSVHSDVGRLCADGRALPLGDGHFSAVCHADVLC